MNAGFAIFGVGVLWAPHHFVGLSAWAAYTLGFFAVFGVMSDAINVPYVKHKLRQLD